MGVRMVRRQVSRRGLAFPKQAQHALRRSQHSTELSMYSGCRRSKRLFCSACWMRDGDYGPLYNRTSLTVAMTVFQHHVACSGLKLHKKKVFDLDVLASPTRFSATARGGARQWKVAVRDSCHRIIASLPRLGLSPSPPSSHLQLNPPSVLPGTLTSQRSPPCPPTEGGWFRCALWRLSFALLRPST